MSVMLARLRGVRHLEIYALLALVALAFLLMNLGGAPPDGQGTPGATALEQRIERVLSEVSGAGRVRVLVREKDEAAQAFGAADKPGAQSAQGVVVVAEGAKSIRVQLELQRAVKALLGVELERIEVLPMQGNGGNP